MPSVPINSIRKGNTIMWNGSPHVIVATEHVKPGKGPAYVQAKMKNVKMGRIVENRFNSSDKVDLVHTHKQRYTYSYDSGDNFIFMHSDTFEEYGIPRSELESQILFLKSGDEIEVEFADGEFMSLKLPKVVVHEITETPPAIKGATATNQLKPATTETGLQVKVPPFLDVGMKVRIDTDTGNYMERAKE